MTGEARQTISQPSWRPLRRPIRWRGLSLGVLVVALVVIPVLIPEELLDVNRARGQVLAPPSRDALFGTDENGISVLLLTLCGARLSVVVGLLATALAMAVGTVTGLAVDRLPRTPAAVLEMVTEWFVIAPTLPVALVVTALLGKGIGALVTAIAVTSWATTARLTTIQSRLVEGRPYVERARALGMGGWSLARRHVLPGVLPVVQPESVLCIANAILSEAALSFLGLGDARQCSWGAMLRRAALSGAISAGAWWYVLVPGAAIASITLVGASYNHRQERHHRRSRGRI